MSTSLPSTAEAYKAIIDFDKVIISISSTVLTAVIAYLALQGGEYEIRSYTCLGILIISIICSLWSFGEAIMTVKDGTSRKAAVLMANLSAIAFIIGLLSVLLIKPKKEQNIDAVLTSIEKSTKSMKNKLTSDNCTSVELTKENYIVHYKSDTSSITVTYSLNRDTILQIK